ncbi:hypothetical protein SLEP1_g21374 [Rubroshorea leprosula]|uniref:Uncharacterized protein n=1 Tax=Rubroshorea leprosula TaxID=152421 RepID=A0AAV5J5Q4_9ROSI|nr:hypothetical protein SLEP1_g21374 [Rubroshorea leprosula]
MAFFWLRRHLYGADSASRSAILRLRNKRKELEKFVDEIGTIGGAKKKSNNSVV